MLLNVYQYHYYPLAHISNASQTAVDRVSQLTQSALASIPKKSLQIMNLGKNSPLTAAVNANKYLMRQMRDQGVDSRSISRRDVSPMRNSQKYSRIESKSLPRGAR